MIKILIVEDEKILGEMYRDKFLQEGWEIFLASDANEAREFLNKELPDLILLDILLPGESGLEFLAKLRQDKLFSNLTVVAFSNYDDLETKKKAFSLGVKEYLPKTGYTPQEMTIKLKTYFNAENSK